jgi:hypothetical protein
MAIAVAIALARQLQLMFQALVRPAQLHILYREQYNCGLIQHGVQDHLALATAGSCVATI